MHLEYIYRLLHLSMNRFKILCAVLMGFLLSNCRNPADHSDISTASLKELPVLCQEGGMPNLFVSETGTIFLTWIEFLNDTTDALYFSTMKRDKWSTPGTIALGTDWFVNWADFPSLAVYRGNDDFLTVHWLRKSASGTYDYDIQIAQSQDHGRHWRQRFIPHRDSVAAEHGFVSLLPLPQYKMLAVWLDGRKMVSSDTPHANHDHGHGGPMTLRCAIFDTEGYISYEHELDDQVCECCQTDAVIASSGIVVVYRDRSAEEVRDISIVRFRKGQWTTPKTIYTDNWKIAGCPVNGPAIAAVGDTLAVAWFSAPEGVAQVKVAFSFDGGETFANPVRIDEGKPLGRVDIVMLSRNEAFVSWIENTDHGAQVVAATVGPKQKRGENIVITHTSESRQSGFPVMEKTGTKIVFAWTQVDSVSVVKTATLALHE